MEFIFITNDCAKARIAERAGVDRVMVDLEVEGKYERQGHLNTVISQHSISDIIEIRHALSSAQVMVRVNPLSVRSGDEIDRCVDAKANIIMLPMFTGRGEVERFVEMVDGRARVSLLLETPQALADVDEILACAGIDEIHIGLNDLHLAMGLSFMFELLANCIVERLAEKVCGRGIRFGFGGVAQLGGGQLSPRLILSEHVRLGSTMVILSRGFHRMLDAAASNLDPGAIADRFVGEVAALRDCLDELRDTPADRLRENQLQLALVVEGIVNTRRAQ